MYACCSVVGVARVLLPQATAIMADSDEELLFSSVRSESAGATALATDDDSVGMASAVLKLFKLDAGDGSDGSQWAATCLCLSSALEELHHQTVFWHLRDFFYRLGWSPTVRLDQWLRSPPPLLE